MSEAGDLHGDSAMAAPEREPASSSTQARTADEGSAEPAPSPAQAGAAEASEDGPVDAQARELPTDLGSGSDARQTPEAKPGAAALATSRAKDEADQEKRQKNEDSWMKHEKNVLVFSRAGKPIYSSNGDELELSSVFSLLQAMLAKTDDRLRVIRAGPRFVMVFAVCGPLMLVVSSRRDEPVGFLQLQLEFLYAQILFHFTLSALEDAFKRKPGYDLRGLLGGARTELEGIVEMASSSPALMLQAVPTLRLPTEVRTEATNILFSVRQSNVVYAILLAGDHLVTHIAPKRHPLLASDLLLLMNFVSKAKQLRSQETWTPLCLPGFNSTGFLHAYAAFVSEGTCLLLLSSGESLDQFHYCSESKASVAAQLAQTGVAAKIEAAVREGPLPPQNCEGASSIHMVFRSLKYDQYFETAVASHAPLHSGQVARAAVLARYANVSERLHAYRRRIQLVAPTDGGAAGQKEDTSYAAGVELGEIWDVRSTEAVLAVLSPPNFEAYASFHSFTSATQAMSCLTRFAAWARGAKHDLFVVKPPTW